MLFFNSAALAFLKQKSLASPRNTQVAGSISFKTNQFQGKNMLHAHFNTNDFISRDTCMSSS
jgi:hypothetical protein